MRAQSHALLVLALLAACSSFESAPETTAPRDAGADAPTDAGSLYDHVLGPERVTAHYLAGRAP